MDRSIRGNNIVMSNYANRNLPVSNDWLYMFNITNLRIKNMDAILNN
ncbi:MAG: hypothetical protein IPL97_00005 [Niastella sp.]|nr:hypothetical protein [Niastella sp.]